MRDRKVLITGGPTWVPIDGMRVIGNLSTGEMAQRLASGLAAKGAQVVLLEGPVRNKLVSKKVKTISFTFFDELKSGLNNELKKGYDAVIHAAAVSDYRLKKPLRNKIASSLDSLKLELVPTEKLILSIKKAAPESLLVGFKLETKMDKAAALRETQKLFKEADCDLVVANCLNMNGYKGYLIGKEKKILATARSREEMAEEIINNLSLLMDHR